MANLTDEQRREVFIRWMRTNAEGVSITKAELRAAVDAVDGWLEANQASFNAAIPNPARSQLNAKQKALLAAFVALRRHEVI